MSDFWNERYNKTEYIYGKEPNIFLAGQLKDLPAGSIIFPCEGEGRNAVYAASQGWTVNAFDTSEAGLAKASRLAAGKGVSIHYIIDDAVTVSYPQNSADAVAIIYAHFPPDVRNQFLPKVAQWLKPGGRIIMEVFNTRQLNNPSGGPKDISMLYTEEMIKSFFGDFQILLLQSTQTDLNEGSYHAGTADVLRFVAIKP